MNTRIARLLASMDALLYLALCAGLYARLTSDEIPLLTHHGLLTYTLFFAGPIALSTLLLQKYYAECGMSLFGSLVSTTLGSLIAGIVIIFVVGPYSLLSTVAANIAEVLPQVLSFPLMIGLLYLCLGLAAGALAWAANRIVLACLPMRQTQSLHG